MMIIVIPLSIALIGYAVAGLLKRTNFPQDTNGKKFNYVFKIIAEIVFIYVLPGIGIYTTNDKCDVHPFQNDSTPTAYTLWIFFVIVYSVSKYFKKYLAPLVLTAIASALIIGVLFCLAICIHFLPAFAAIIFPGFGLLYLSPFFCLAYLIKEVIQLNNYLKEYFETHEVKGSVQLKEFYVFIDKHRLSLVLIFIGPLLLAIQALLFLFGQRPDSIITQFTESCGYLLSNYQDCSCGGGHYLCSIAANGNKKLVKPTRFGVRANERIVVNRQLLVANAFENWLEDHTPKLHRVVRNAYDGCNIPVNKWSKHKRFANVLYVLMKPLEWLFLLWLYLFDKKPEDRIAKQYYPKKELNIYLKTNNYERSN